MFLKNVINLREKYYEISLINYKIKLQIAGVHGVAQIYIIILCDSRRLPGLALKKQPKKKQI